MAHSRRITPVVLLVAFFTTVSMNEACAYIDPATGSYLFQLLIAGMLGGAVALKLYWRGIVGFFQKLRSNRHPGTDDEE